MSTLPPQSPAPTAPTNPAPTQPGMAQPALTPTPASQSLSSLIGQRTELGSQLTGLLVQQRLQRSFMNSSRLDPATRAEQIAKYAELNGQIAQVQGQLAQVNAEIAIRQGATPQAMVPPPFRDFGRGVNQNVAAGLFFAFIFAVMMPISIAFARRIWRGRPAPVQPTIDPLAAQRLERLEQAIDAIAIEVERISEGQRFVTKVLVERPAQTPAASTASAARASEIQPNAEQPLRALGAGPAEPIRMPEAQKVRQSITPH